MKRSALSLFFEILLLVLDAIGLTILFYFFIPTAKALFGGVDDFGELLALILLFLPMFIIIAPVVSILGIILTVVGVKEKRKPEVKDGFSLVILIVGILTIVITIVMAGIVFIPTAMNSGNAS